MTATTPVLSLHADPAVASSELADLITRQLTRLCRGATEPAGAAAGWHRLTAFGLTIDPLATDGVTAALADTVSPETSASNPGGVGHGRRGLVRRRRTAAGVPRSRPARRDLLHRRPVQRALPLLGTRLRALPRRRRRQRRRMREGAADRERQERFVLADALPVAAILRGYQVLHVSAPPGTPALRRSPAVRHRRKAPGQPPRGPRRSFSHRRRSRGGSCRR